MWLNVDNVGDAQKEVHKLYHKHNGEFQHADVKLIELAYEARPRQLTWWERISGYIQ
jgi:hypothetical protein